MATNHGPVIAVNLYTTGDKLLKPDGSPYYGYYHIHQDYTYMTGKDHTPGVPMYELKLKYPSFFGFSGTFAGAEQTEIPLTPDGQKLILEEDKLKKDQYKPITTQTVLKKYPNKKYQAAIDTSIYELIDIAAVPPIEMVTHPTQNWVARQNEGKITCAIKYDIYLPCQATSTKNLNLTYKWMKDGEYVISQTAPSGTKVICPSLKDVKVDRTGFWTCEISDPDGNIMISDGVYIDVIDPNELETFGGNIIKNGDAKQDLSYWQVIGPTQPVPLSLDRDMGRYNLSSSITIKGSNWNSPSKDPDDTSLPSPEAGGAGTGFQNVGYDAFEWLAAGVFDLRNRDKNGQIIWNSTIAGTGIPNKVSVEEFGYRPDKNARYFYGGWGETTWPDGWGVHQQNLYSTMRQDIDLAEIADIVDAQNPAAGGVPGGSGSIKGITRINTTLWGWLGSIGWTEHISSQTSHHTYSELLFNPGPPGWPGIPFVNRSVNSLGAKPWWPTQGANTSVAGDESPEGNTGRPGNYDSTANYTNAWTIGGGWTNNKPLNWCPETGYGKSYYRPNTGVVSPDSAPLHSSIWWDYRHTTATDWQRTQVHDKVFVTIDFYDANESVLNTSIHAIQNYQYWNDLPHSLWYIFYTGHEARGNTAGYWTNILDWSRTSKTDWIMGPNNSGWIDGKGTDAVPNPKINKAPEVPTWSSIVLPGVATTTVTKFGKTWTGADVDLINFNNGSSFKLLGANEQGSAYYGNKAGGDPQIDGGLDFTRTISTNEFTNKQYFYQDADNDFKRWSDETGVVDGVVAPAKSGVNIAGFHGYPYKHIHDQSRFFFSRNTDINIPPLTRKAVVTIKWERDPNRGYTYNRLGEKYNPNKYKGGSGSPPGTSGTYGLEFMCGATNIGAQIIAYGLGNAPLTGDHRRNLNSGMHSIYGDSANLSSNPTTTTAAVDDNPDLMLEGPDLTSN